MAYQHKRDGTLNNNVSKQKGAPIRRESWGRLGCVSVYGPMGFGLLCGVSWWTLYGPAPGHGLGIHFDDGSRSVDLQCCLEPLTLPGSYHTVKVHLW